MNRIALGALRPGAGAEKGNPANPANPGILSKGAADGASALHGRALLPLRGVPEFRSGEGL